MRNVDDPGVGVFNLIRTENSFRRMWFGQCVSEVGDWFHLIALISMLPKEGTATFALAGLFLVRHLSTLVFTPLAAVVADRFHRGTVMIVTDLLRALVALSFISVRGPEDLGKIYFLSFLMELLSGIFEPARGAAVPQVVPPSKLYDANILGSATWSGMLSIGAFLGGVVTSHFGRNASFAINAASYLLSALFIAAARVPALPAREATAEGPSFKNDISDAIRYLRTHPAQASVLSVKAGAMITGGMLVLVGVFAERVFLAGTRAAFLTGLFFAARGVGALIGPFIIQRMFSRDIRGLRGAISIVYLVTLTAFAGFALSPNVPLAMFALVVAYSGTSTAWVNSTQLLQLTVPNRLLGRVLSVELALLTLGLSFSNLTVTTLLATYAWTPRHAGLALAAMFVIPLVTWRILSARFGPTLDREAIAQ